MPPKKKAKSSCRLMCCTTPPGVVEKIRADLERWRPGGWAEEVNRPPACRCGLKRNPMQIGFGKDDGSCPRHGSEAQG